ncbi:hypothetical protein VKT23_008598 [Stygiomarasmius scandens]|uniref:Uncharacterized protein n=1 Tax=Marasmiellus scandens TaxID=2682957 RepID=A0ABR1JHZ3_9AGAR
MYSGDAAAYSAYSSQISSTLSLSNPSPHYRATTFPNMGANSSHQHPFNMNMDSASGELSIPHTLSPELQITLLRHTLAEKNQELGYLKNSLLVTVKDLSEYTTKLGETVDTIHSKINAPPCFCSPQHKQEDFPLVKHWKNPKTKKKSKDSSFDVEETKLVGDTTWYITHQDGSPISTEYADEMCAHGCMIWQDLKLEGIHLTSWGAAGLRAYKTYEELMCWRFVELSYGENNWKAHRLTCDNYPSWHKTYGTDLNSIKVEGDDNGPSTSKPSNKRGSSEAPPAGKHRKVSTPSPLRTSTTPDPVPTTAISNPISIMPTSISNPESISVATPIPTSSTTSTPSAASVSTPPPMANTPPVPSTPGIFPTFSSNGMVSQARTSMSMQMPPTNILPFTSASMQTPPPAPTDILPSASASTQTPPTNILPSASTSMQTPPPAPTNILPSASMPTQTPPTNILPSASVSMQTPPPAPTDILPSASTSMQTPPTNILPSASTSMQMHLPATLNGTTHQMPFTTSLMYSTPVGTTTSIASRSFLPQLDLPLSPSGHLISSLIPTNSSQRIDAELSSAGPSNSHSQVSRASQIQDKDRLAALAAAAFMSQEEKFEMLNDPLADMYEEPEEVPFLNPSSSSAQLASATDNIKCVDSSESKNSKNRKACKLPNPELTDAKMICKYKWVTANPTGSEVQFDAYWKNLGTGGHKPYMVRATAFKDAKKKAKGKPK